MSVTALIPATPTVGKTTSSRSSFRCRPIHRRNALRRLAAAADDGRGPQSGSWPTDALIRTPHIRRCGAQCRLTHLTRNDRPAQRHQQRAAEGIVGDGPVLVIVWPHLIRGRRLVAATTARARPWPSAKPCRRRRAHQWRRPRRRRRELATAGRWGTCRRGPASPHGRETVVSGPGR